MPERNAKIELRKEDLPEGGTYREVFDIVEPIAGESEALRIVAALAEYYGGQQVYFPKRETLMRAARDRAIRAGFDGDPGTLREIARGHKLSLSFTREIVSGGG